MALPLLALAATAALSAHSQPIVDEACAHATVEHCRQLTDAIKSSPALARQLDSVVLSGALTSIAIVDRQDAPKVRAYQFGASYVGTGIVLAAQFLDAVKNNHMTAVPAAGGLYPDNLVFVLGHLAHNAAMARRIQQAEAAIHREAAAASEGGALDATAGIKEGMTLHLGNEAAAYLQGWNDVVDAATNANGGTSLSWKQALPLMTNLRYRAALIKAIQNKADPLQMSEGGTIAADNHNIELMMAVIKTMPIADIQPE